MDAFRSHPRIGESRAPQSAPTQSAMWSKQEQQSVQVETAQEPIQMTIFTPLSQKIVDRIESTDVNSLTPLQALNLLEELQTELKEKKE